MMARRDPAKCHTVGTYFGHVDRSGTADGAKDDRLIKTGGGKITLNGEIAIGLNGGTLTLDSNGGAVTATGIINFGNSYGAYVYGTDTWNTLVKQTVESYLKTGTVPAYHYQGVNYVKDGSNNYVKNADGTYQYTTVAQNFVMDSPITPSLKPIQMSAGWGTGLYQRQHKCGDGICFRRHRRRPTLEQ